MAGGRIKDWKTSEVIALLREGRDIPLCFDIETMAQWYPEYYWRQISELASAWSLDCDPIGEEPARLG